MSDNWVVQNLQNALDTWNKYLTEIWQLILKLASYQSLQPVPLRVFRGSRSGDCGRTTAMSRDPATLSFSIGMMAVRMVLPIMLVSWRKWRMAVSIPSRETPVIAAVKTVTRLVTMKSMDMEPRHINNPKRKIPAVYAAGYIFILRFLQLIIQERAFLPVFAKMTPDTLVSTRC